MADEPDGKYIESLLGWQQDDKKPNTLQTTCI